MQRVISFTKLTKPAHGYLLPAATRRYSTPRYYPRRRPSNDPSYSKCYNNYYKYKIFY